MTESLFPIVLDLCGGTGSWSKPYADAQYDVRVVDPQVWKGGEGGTGDVRLLDFPGPVHGILAAPPCTYFCRMRMCRGRPTDEQFLEGLSVVDACLRLVALCQPKWWALENPQGYLHKWLGPPALKFHPWEYGDPWTKRTWIWGTFNKPRPDPVDPVGPLVNSRTGHPDGRPGLAKTQIERATTPPGFARAFFEANP